jgi:hypothetical protein
VPGGREGTATAAPPAAGEAGAPAAATGAAAPLDPRRLNEAWRATLADRQALPPGLGMALTAAVRVAALADDAVRVELPASHLSLEPVTSAGNRRALEAQLRRRLGRPVSLVFVAAAGKAGAANGTRITGESARRGRLERMMEGEPVLAAAVEALDLELVD